MDSKDSNSEHIFNDMTLDCRDDRVVMLGSLRRLINRLPNEALLDIMGAKVRFVCTEGPDVHIAIVPRNEENCTRFFVGYELETVSPEVAEKILSHHLARAVILNGPRYEGDMSERERIREKLKSWSLLANNPGGNEQGESEAIPASAGAAA